MTAITFLTLISMLGCGLVAGIFFAFSSFVMNALGRMPAAQGMAAMQSINVAVLNPLFLTTFLGTAASCAVLGVWSVWRWDRPEAALLLAGSLLYLGGTILVTGVCNVPRNDALARTDAASIEGARLWATYLSNWTWWNHVRTIAALLAAACLALALLRRA